ncbi:MAG: zinc ribbon domain-containing protein [Candidatus Aenigmatarchaeota archaeon]
MLEVRKTVRVKVVGDNENLRNTLNAWNIAKWKYRRNENFNLPATLKASMKLFDCFEVSHLTFCETGFNIDFENNTIWLTSLEKRKRTPIKVAEENIEYLKKEIENGAKATLLTILPPSYKKGKHRRREIVKNGHWKLHITLKKNIELMTIEEFRKFQRIAVIGIDLNSKHGVAYSLWIWDKSNNSIKPMKFAFVKPKIKSHQFQEIKKWQLQENHGISVKYNELFQRINARIQRQNKDWIEKVSKNLIDIALNSIEKYNCNITAISFEDLSSYEAGNNSKRINKKNAEWLRKIIKRTFEKSLWNYSMKVLTYLPTFNKNQRNIQQVLVDSYRTSRICSRCGSYGKIGKGKEFFCSKCGLINNKHINASKNIAKRTIEILRKI